MTVVLLTGSAPRVADVAAALAAAGCECVPAHDAASAQSAVERLGGRPLDAYVQLPAEITSSATTAIGRIGDLLRDGLVARFDAAATAVAAMRAGGTVVLVAGNSPGDRQLTDDQRARYALLRVLSHAVLADSAGRAIRSIVLPAGTSAADITAAVLDGRSPRDTTIADFVEAPSELSYADWRVELLALATHES